MNSQQPDWKSGTLPLSYCRKLIYSWSIPTAILSIIKDIAFSTFTKIKSMFILYALHQTNILQKKIQHSKILHIKFMAPQGGFEPYPIYRLEGDCIIQLCYWGICSVQLSYGDICFCLTFAEPYTFWPQPPHSKQHPTEK